MGAVLRSGKPLLVLLGLVKVGIVEIGLVEDKFAEEDLVNEGLVEVGSIQSLGSMTVSLVADGLVKVGPVYIDAVQGCLFDEMNSPFVGLRLSFGVLLGS